MEYNRLAIQIIFQRQVLIRRNSNVLEDLLKEKYPGQFGQPQVFPIPDEFDPSVPRIVFSSNDNREIVVSQNTISLTQNFVPAEQNTSTIAMTLRKQSVIVWDLFSQLNQNGLYAGITENITFPIKDEITFTTTLHHCRPTILAPQNTIPYSVELRTADVVDNMYFNNVILSIEQKYNLDPLTLKPVNCAQALSRIAVTCDFNDRYAYNTDQYTFSKDTYNNLVYKFETHRTLLYSLLEKELIKDANTL